FAEGGDPLRLPRLSSGVRGRARFSPRDVWAPARAVMVRAVFFVGTLLAYDGLVPIVVQKYGGSSVADVSRMQRVAERVMRTKRQGHDVVVVVSAMGDTTDELLALAKQVSPNPDRRELDMLLTAGERIAMALLSMAIRELGGDAISFTGSQSGIVTNDRHVDARIIEVRPFRVQDELARGKIVGIAIYARATASPLPGADPSADGTVVRRHPPKMPGRVVGVASERDVLVIESSAPTEALLALLDAHHVAGKQLHATPDHLVVVVSRENLHEGERVLASLRERFGARLRLAERVGALSVIGAGINASFEN